MNPNTCSTCAAKIVPRKIWAGLPADRRAELREKGQRQLHRAGQCSGCYRATLPRKERAPIIQPPRPPEIVPVDPEEFEWDARTDEIYGALDGRWMPKPGNPLVRVWAEAA